MWTSQLPQPAAQLALSPGLAVLVVEEQSSGLGTLSHTTLAIHTPTSMAQGWGGPGDARHV